MEKSGLAKKHPDESGQVVFGSWGGRLSGGCQTLACVLAVLEYKWKLLLLYM